ncbi:MAG: hypothetical protein ACFFDD_03490 [Promethearchaeota archaeon]
MSDLVSLIMMVVFITGILLLLALQPSTGFATTGMKFRRAIPSSWRLSEFLKMKTNPRTLNQYYYFSEEKVRSLGHRFIGRLDGAVLHHEKTPVLDLIVEYKFPLKQLPKQARPEDIFQSGLYTLALLESGVSCTSTRLVTIYCLQDRAKTCFEKKSKRDCWHCSDGKTFVNRFRQKRVLRNLERLDEVWYKGRQPNPSQKRITCRVCPYSKGKCNYSLV